MTTTQFDRTSSTAPPAASSSFARFLWIFTTLGLIVVIVVIGFLIGIVRALESIENADSRGTALVTPQVNAINFGLQGAENDLSTINLQLAETNRHLTNICTSPTLSLLPPLRCDPARP